MRTKHSTYSIVRRFIFSVMVMLTCQAQATSSLVVSRNIVCGITPKKSISCVGLKNQAINTQINNVDAIAIAMSQSHICYLNERGEVFCGHFRLRGNRPDGVMRPVESVQHARAIAVGNRISCAILDMNAKLHCWHNYSLRSVRYDKDPMLDDVRSIAMKKNLLCAVNDSNGAYCWHYVRNKLQTVNFSSKSYFNKVKSIFIESSGKNQTPTVCLYKLDNQIKCYQFKFREDKLEKLEMTTIPTPLQAGSGIPSTLNMVINDRGVCILTGTGKVQCRKKNKMSVIADNVSAISGGASYMCMLQNNKLSCFEPDASDIKPYQLSKAKFDSGRLYFNWLKEKENSHMVPSAYTDHLDI